MMSITYNELLRIARTKGVKNVNSRGKLVKKDVLIKRIESRNTLNDTKVEMTDLYRTRGNELAKKYEK